MCDLGGTHNISFAVYTAAYFPSELNFVALGNGSDITVRTERISKYVTGNCATVGMKTYTFRKPIQTGTVWPFRKRMIAKFVRSTQILQNATFCSIYTT